MNESIDFEFTQAPPSKGRRWIWAVAAAVILLPLITLIVIIILLTVPTRYRIFQNRALRKWKSILKLP